MSMGIFGGAWILLRRIAIVYYKIGLTCLYHTEYLRQYCICIQVKICCNEQ